MDAGLPTKLSFADVAALGLTGRRFEAREGVWAVRGVIGAISVEGERLRIDVTTVERRRAGGAWEQGVDFDYQGHRTETSIFQEPDGVISVAITFIGTINILRGVGA